MLAAMSGGVSRLSSGPSRVPSTPFGGGQPRRCRRDLLLPPSTVAIRAVAPAPRHCAPLHRTKDPAPCIAPARRHAMDPAHHHDDPAHRHDDPAHRHDDPAHRHDAPAPSYSPRLHRSLHQRIAALPSLPVASPRRNHPLRRCNLTLPWLLASRSQLMLTMIQRSHASRQLTVTLPWLPLSLHRRNVTLPQINDAKPLGSPGFTHTGTTPRPFSAHPIALLPTSPHRKSSSGGGAPGGPSGATHPSSLRTGHERTREHRAALSPDADGPAGAGLAPSCHQSLRAGV